MAGAGTSQYGPWRVGDTVVSAILNGFTAYAAADGQAEWKLRLQTPDVRDPPAPSATGKLVVGVKESASESSRCTHLQQIDLTTGRAGWKVSLPAENAYDSSTQFEPAISGDTVVVVRSAVMSGFSVTDGRKLFGTSSPNGCYPYGIAGGSRLIAVRQCPDPKDAVARGQAMVEELDPATGAARWSYKYAPDWTVGRVLSVDPLVVAAHHKDKKTWNLTAFAADEQVRSQSVPTFGVSGRCNGFGNATGFQECYAVAADADSLYIGAGKPGTTLGIDVTNQVVAVDLNTGKERWRTAERPKGRTMWPLAVEDGKVLTYVTPGSGEAGAVVALAAADGASRPVLQSPAAAAGPEDVFYTHGIRIAWAGGRLFLLNGRVYSPEPRKASRAILYSASSFKKRQAGTRRGTVQNPYQQPDRHRRPVPAAAALRERRGSPTTGPGAGIGRKRRPLVVGIGALDRPGGRRRRDRCRARRPREPSTAPRRRPRRRRPTRRSRSSRAGRP